MEWVEGFYSRTGTWWGQAESALTARDTDRLRILERHTTDRSPGPHPPRQPQPLRILDLGSSYGTTPFVMAQAGHHVTGVELSERITFTDRLDRTALTGDLRFVQADFYAFEPDAGMRFDVVTYWNGFGIGSDADQRRLLRRMAERWLAPEGIVLLDVFNPVRCAQWAGDEEYRDARPEAGYPFSVRERTDFDPIGNRFIDTWWEADHPEAPISQSLRCYSPADLLLLLEGTGLRAAAFEVAGEPFSPGEGTGADSAHPLWRHHEYLAVLERDPA
ncbi:MAG: class I SAM-dependent methyltransferase [Thermomicrobiales bacterium]